MTIGQQINLIRNKRNITLDQLAMMSGVSKSTINSWIYRDKYPNLEPLMKVANALKVSLDELVGRDVKYDRDTALAVLKDLSGNMHPRINMMGQPTLEISRNAFEEVRHKYLDMKDGAE